MAKIGEVKKRERSRITITDPTSVNLEKVEEVLQKAPNATKEKSAAAIDYEALYVKIPRSLHIQMQKTMIDSGMKKKNLFIANAIECYLESIKK